MDTLVLKVLPVSHHCSQLSGSGTKGAVSRPVHQWRTCLPSIGEPQLSSVPALPLMPSTVPLHPSAYHVKYPEPPPYTFWNFGLTKGSSNVALKFTSAPIPFFVPAPLFVVIRITPFAAREP